jgi:hypothetical protein
MPAAYRRCIPAQVAFETLQLQGFRHDEVRVRPSTRLAPAARCNVPLPMKQWHGRNVRGINALNERTPQPVLLLVLRFSDAAGGGRIALTLKKSSAAFPKSRQRTLAAFFVAAAPGPLMQHRPPRHCYAACD